MIFGSVNDNVEATLPLTILGIDGRKREVTGVIDTGFSGDLTLPMEVIESLELEWVCRDVGVMADGREELIDVYCGTIRWDGEPCEVEVSQTETVPLIGMGLLLGHVVKLEVVRGGVVEITPVPR